MVTTATATHQPEPGTLSRHLARSLLHLQSQVRVGQYSTINPPRLPLLHTLPRGNKPYKHTLTLFVPQRPPSLLTPPSRLLPPYQVSLAHPQPSLCNPVPPVGSHTAACCAHLSWICSCCTPQPLGPGTAPTATTHTGERGCRGRGPPCGCWGSWGPGGVQRQQQMTPIKQQNGHPAGDASQRVCGEGTACQEWTRRMLYCAACASPRTLDRQDLPAEPHTSISSCIGAAAWLR